MVLAIDFVLSFLGWMLFYMGVVNLARDAYRNAYLSCGVSFKSDSNLVWRIFFGAACFVGWQLLVF